MTLSDRLRAATEKFAKWRLVFASWQLGTRSKTDPECQAVRDHREATMMLRAEVNALTRLLFTYTSVTQEDFERVLLDEIEYLDRGYEQRFPGIRTDAEGV